MRITKDNATFSQNKTNYYIGNIDTSETILIDSEFIIIGNIKTTKNILSECNLIVMGDIEAKSIYMCKDLLCTGKINTEISEVEGELKILEKNILSSYIKSPILQVKEEKNIETHKNKSNENYVDISDQKKDDKGVNYSKYERVRKKEDLNEGDIVIHNSLGEGRFVSLCGNKIKIDFKTKGIRNISSDITFKLELLKKRNEDLYKTEKESLSKQEYIKKIDNFINRPNKINKSSNGALKRSNIKKDLDEIRINNLYKNKSITFYVKDINSCIVGKSYGIENEYEFHYIKFNDEVYIRLNHICEFLQINNSGLDKYIENPIKISYYSKSINGIKYIKLKDIKYIISYLREKCSYGYITLDENKVEILLYIEKYIQYDANENLKNSTPYLTYVINEILDKENMNIEELAEKWNVNTENIEMVKLGYTSSFSKIKQLIKENKIANLMENEYKIRSIKLENLNTKYSLSNDVEDELIIEKSKIDIISDNVYELLESYNYNEQDIDIKSIEKNTENLYVVDLDIKYMRSVSNTISLIEYLSYKVSELTKEYVKLNLVYFDREKFICEIMEINEGVLKLDLYSNKYYITIDIDDYDSKYILLEENQSYIKHITGYDLELIFNDKDNKEIEILSNRHSGKKVLNKIDKKIEEVTIRPKNKTLRVNRNIEILSKDEIARLLQSKNIAFKNNDIYEFECKKVIKSYSGCTFDYVKYNGKIYARAGQISSILNIDINRLYPHLEEYIKVHYLESFASNTKFASFKSILKGINKVQQMYPREKISVNRVNLITKCIDKILKESKNLDESIPYWTLVLNHMLFDLNLSKEELETKWGISNYDVEFMSLGFSPSNAKSKALIKDEIKI